MNIGCLILAAGSSSRLGRPKQLLKYKEETLIEKTISTALSAGISNVYVVLGYEFEIIRNAIPELPVKIIHHRKWQEGIGSSIRTGIIKMEQEEHFDAILIMLCDQLHISSYHLKSLTEAYLQNHKSIVATGYGHGTGVPALFDKRKFQSLRALIGDNGAKAIINENSKDVYVVNFERAGIDIDLPEDLIHLE
jgi:molybdenum cofactor cytidylyltransferase